MMRAKMCVTDVQEHKQENDQKYQETLRFQAVGKTDGYADDGLDEDNTFSKYTPAANLSIVITNPALFDKFKVGDKFYVDFSPAE